MLLHSKLQDQNKDLENQKHLLLESKVWRLKEVALAQVSKNKVVNEMALVDEWLNNMSEKVSDAKRVTKMAMRKARYDTKLVETCLTRLKELRTQAKEVKDDLADKSHLRENLEKMGIIRREIKTERLICRCGGKSHWPFHICMLVC